MEAELQKIVRVYLKSSKGKEYLGKKDFQNLVSSQLSNILTEADSKDAVDNMSKSLDSDQNGVGFDDYMKLVGYLACSLSQQQGEEQKPDLLIFFKAFPQLFRLLFGGATPFPSLNTELTCNMLGL
uniref:S100/CaBP-9k-type calcium binding subdomain domain-containing protein n=1 Tax=Oryzias sinensis TaxID=183150 RepID=A0A8C7WPZ2_9TELE